MTKTNAEKMANDIVAWLCYNTCGDPELHLALHVHDNDELNAAVDKLVEQHMNDEGEPDVSDEIKSSSGYELADMLHEAVEELLSA